MERAGVWAADTYDEFVRIMAEEEDPSPRDEAGAGADAVARDSGGGSGGGVGGSGGEAWGVRMQQVRLYDDLPERPPRPLWVGPAR
jgi:hypothetical protein